MTDTNRTGTPAATRAERFRANEGLLVLPALLVCTIFIFVPAFLTIVGSFYSFGLTSQTWDPVGFGNYVRAAGDPVFWIALKNNLIIVLGSMPISTRA